MSQCCAIASSTRELIRQLGGTNAVAAAFGVKPSAVSNWLHTDIPPMHHARMLSLAVRRGVFWRPPGWPPELQLRWHEPRQEATALLAA